MTDPRFRFRPNTPNEVVGAIASHLERWAFLVPAWCREVNIVWNDREADTGALSVAVYYEYRNADIEVLPNFLTNSEGRERHVVHELIHLSLSPLTTTAEAMRDALVKKVPDVEDWATEMIRQGEESVTCDLAALMLDRFQPLSENPRGFAL
jgi:hypothetical protein